jgi:hypothetical protein
MPSSTNSATPKTIANNISGRCHPDASRVRSATRRDVTLLTAEDIITYRKWRRSTLILYGAFAIAIAAFWIAIGASNTSLTSKNNEIHSALPPAGQKPPR